jgi:membrane fusion protein (multidrug efflux system)
MEQTEPSIQTRDRSRALKILSGIVILSLLAGSGYYLHARNYEKTDDAFIEGHIVQISPRVSGHVKAVHIEDNQQASQGQILVELDEKDFQTRVNSAQASLNVAAAMIEQSKAQMDAAKTSLDTANSDLRRYESLLRDGAITQQEYDRIKNRAVSAQAELNTLLKQITAAEARQMEAKANLEGSQLLLSYTKITAPVAGQITKKSVEPGEYVQTGQPLCAIVQQDFWVVANFKETQLTHMQPGQPVTIKVDAFGGRSFKAHVDSIQAGTGARFSLLPPENATGNYVKVVQRVPVKIVFDEPVEQLRKLAPGMSVVPKVKVR